MPPTRRRRRADVAASAQPGATPAVADKKDRRDPSVKEKPARRPLGRAFWIYLGVMMVVLIPMNLFCLSPNSQGPGQATELQEVVVLDSVDAPRDAYITDPPTSGAMVAEPAKPGVHDATIPGPVQVASLYQGYVIVHYNCESCPDVMARLQRIAAEYEGADVIVQPNPSIAPDQVVVTAWNRMQRQEKFDEAGTRQFIDEWAGFDRRLVPNANPTP